jgi:hypothetical protein
MDKPLDDDELRSLARAIARGWTATSWAKTHDANSGAAEDSCRLPEFKGHLDAYRLRVTGQIMGKLMAACQDSVDQIHTVAEYSPDDTARVAASKTLLNQWLKIAGRFDTATQIAGMKAELAELKKKKTNVRIQT